VDVNDSFKTMRSAVMLGLLVACGEQPSLRVEVTHHPDAAPVVARTVISVYESDVVSCARVEFGDLSEAALTAIEVDQIAIGAGERADELTMSREGIKVIVARGFDDTGVLIAAGCAETTTVAENDVLSITTELAATVSVNGIGLEDLDPFGILVTVTDPFVRSLPDRVVSWRVHGSDGAAPLSASGLATGDDSDWVPTGPPCSNDNGIARVHPVPPSTIGGFATAVRASWSTEPPRVFTTFTPINGSGGLVMTPVADGSTLSVRRCASRIAGSVHRLVCLENRGNVPTAIDYTVTVVNGSGGFAEVAQQTFPVLAPGELPIEVFSISRGATTRDAYAITTKGRLLGLFGPSLGTDFATTRSGAASVTDIAVLPACGPHPTTLLIRLETVLAAKELRTLAVSATGILGGGEVLEPYGPPAVAAAEQLSINATGCVAELRVDADPILRQVGVVDVTRTNPAARSSTTAYFECDTGTCTLPFAVPRAGVDFLPADDLLPDRMVSATFDATGTVLSVSVLQPDKNREPRAVELERITAAAFPQRVVTGQFDADGRPDLFWDIANFNSATTNFQLSYAHPVLGQRLSALSATQQNAIVIDTFVADVTGDGNDDLVISLQDRLVNPSPSAHRVVVIPGQVDIAPVNLQTDPACTAR